MTSVVLFTLGWSPAAALGPILIGTHGVMPFIADFATGAAAAVAGDQALAGGAGFLEARFRRLQTAFTKRRIDWLLRQLQEQLFGTVPQEVQSAAGVPQSEAFAKLSEATDRLSGQLNRCVQPSDEPAGLSRRTAGINPAARTADSRPVDERG
jgi:hypothetical protein